MKIHVFWELTLYQLVYRYLGDLPFATGYNPEDCGHCYRVSFGELSV
jgi:hypothetical protein